MAAKCSKSGCKNVPYDKCAYCLEQVCKRHGKRVGDRFVCYECAQKHG